MPAVTSAYEIKLRDSIWSRTQIRDQVIMFILVPEVLFDFGENSREEKNQENTPFGRE